VLAALYQRRATRRSLGDLATILKAPADCSSRVEIRPPGVAENGVATHLHQT
jgi:hypothetical protein